MRALPAILSWTDFENRRYRVMQSMWLVSGCVSIYTLLPEGEGDWAVQGWKLNLVTMETAWPVALQLAMGTASPAASRWTACRTCDGRPGGDGIAQLTPFLGPVMAKAITGFGLFYLMGY